MGKDSREEVNARPDKTWLVVTNYWPTRCVRCTKKISRKEKTFYPRFFDLIDPFNFPHDEACANEVTAQPLYSEQQVIDAIDRAWLANRY